MTVKKTGDLIIPGNIHANPRTQAAKTPYDSSQEDKTRSYKKLIGTIKKTAQVGSSDGAGGLQATHTAAQAPLYYDPRRLTPDRYWYPKSRVEANSIWRDFYKRDAIMSVVTDMYAEMPWSDFGLIGLDDGSVKKLYEDMFNDLNLTTKFTDFTKDFLITGEFIPHHIFDSAKGYWNRVISHNPDYIRVVGTGLAIEQPLLYLKPTPEMKHLVKSREAPVKKLLKMLPKQLISSIRGNKEILLDPLNTGFIARKGTSQQVRGTSIFTRVYRINMYEDFIYNASLAVAQRHAMPLRLFKYGDKDWAATDEDFEELISKLSIAESDPLAAVLTRPELTVEYHGLEGKGLLISREWEFIQQVKLVALGVNKAFLVGESSFAGGVVGLQTLLERLSSLRNLFEKQWILKKICEPIAKMHDFYKRPQSELDHRIRVKTPDDMELMVPTLKWRKPLETAEDPGTLNFWNTLKDRGIISDRTLAAGANVDIDIERKNQIEERDYVKDHPDLFGPPDEGGGAGPGGFGGAPGMMGPPGEGEGPSDQGAPDEPLPPPVPLPGASRQGMSISEATKLLRTACGHNGSTTPITTEDVQKFQTLSSDQQTEAFEKAMYNMESHLLEIADKDNNVNVEDIVEHMRNAPDEERKQLEKFARMYGSGKDLLSGSDL